MNFVTIDFETANQMPQSACSVGLARFDESGQVLDTFYSLMKPPLGYDRFFGRNIEIHGIRPADVKDAPDFGYLWPEIEWMYVGGNESAKYWLGVLNDLKARGVEDMTRISKFSTRKF